MHSIVIVLGGAGELGIFVRDFHGKIFGKIFTPGAGTMIQTQYRGCDLNAVPGP